MCWRGWILTFIWFPSQLFLLRSGVAQWRFKLHASDLVSEYATGDTMWGDNVKIHWFSVAVVDQRTLARFFLEWRITISGNVSSLITGVLIWWTHSLISYNMRDNQCAKQYGRVRSDAAMNTMESDDIKERLCELIATFSLSIGSTCGLRFRVASVWMVRRLSVELQLPSQCPSSSSPCFRRSFPASLYTPSHSTFYMSCSSAFFQGNFPIPRVPQDGLS